jgi:hypothetical protein
MPKLRFVAVMAAGCVLVASVCLADANVEHKAQMHFGGALGGVINAFGGKATHEGATSTTFVKGNRKATVMENSAEIVDLDEEKIYHLDLARKTYKVATFDELRKQFEEQKARAEKQAAREQKSEKKEGPEYEVEFDVNPTGAKQVINGFNTHEVIVTVTVHEKGKKLEQSGGWVLTSDLWMGPKIAAMKEITSFDQRYFAKLYGSAYSGADMQQLAMLLATNPAFGKAMKALSQKQGSLEGTAVKTNMTFEAVSGTETAAKSEEESSPGFSPASIVGGFMKRSQQKKQAESGQSPNRSKLFDSSFEVTKATSSASTADVSIPSGFTQR